MFIYKDSFSFLSFFMISVGTIFNGIHFQMLLIRTPRRLLLRQFLETGHVSYAVKEGWASKEAGSDLEKRSSYLGHPIEDNCAPGCWLIETRTRAIHFHSVILFIHVFVLNTLT